MTDSFVTDLMVGLSSVQEVGT